MSDCMCQRDLNNNERGIISCILDMHGLNIYIELVTTNIMKSLTSGI